MLASGLPPSDRPLWADDNTPVSIWTDSKERQHYVPPALKVQLSAPHRGVSVGAKSREVMRLYHEDVVYTPHSDPSKVPDISCIKTRYTLIANSQTSSVVSKLNTTKLLELTIRSAHVADDVKRPLAQASSTNSVCAAWLAAHAPKRKAGDMLTDGGVVRSAELSNEEEACPALARQHGRQQILDSRTVTILTEGRKKAIDYALAAFIYGCALAFMIVLSQNFISSALTHSPHRPASKQSSISCVCARALPRV